MFKVGSYRSGSLSYFIMCLTLFNSIMCIFVTIISSIYVNVLEFMYFSVLNSLSYFSFSFLFSLGTGPAPARGPNRKLEARAISLSLSLLSLLTVIIFTIIIVIIINISIILFIFIIILFIGPADCNHICLVTRIFCGSFAETTNPRKNCAAKYRNPGSRNSLSQLHPDGRLPKTCLRSRRLAGDRNRRRRIRAKTSQKK